MLRSVSWQNFIIFPDAQEMIFESTGTHFLIGQNGSGKSSVFEAIRRCLSVEQSTSQSKRYYKDKLMYVICGFDVPREGNLHGPDVVYSGILQLPQDGDVWFKFAAEIKACNCSFFVDSWNPKIQGGCLKEVEPKRRSEIEQRFLEYKKENGTSSLIEAISDAVKECLMQPLTGKIGNTPCHDLLKMLDKHVVFTFPLRAIGPLQWSKSERIKPEYRKENYDTSQQRAEIIRWFLEQEDGGKEAPYDVEKERCIFATLTDNANFTFKLTKDEDTNENKKKLEVESDVSADFLKTPEGIIEAKQFSLLLSSKLFFTVALEEPAIGMSPEMIERMRDLILPNEDKKTILITTHHPSFVGPWTVERLFIFRKTNKGQVIVKGRELIDKSGKTTSRFVSGEHISKLLFSKKVLFCEGDSDYFFLSELRTKLLRKNKKAMDILKFIGESTIEKGAYEKRLNAISSLQIITMRGQGNKEKLSSVCKKLQLEHFFMMDKDVLCNDKGQLKIKEINQWLVENLKEEMADVADDPLKWDIFRKELQDNHGVFIWRDGAIEEMVSVLLTKQSTILEKCADEKTWYIRTWCPNEKLMNTLKENNVSIKQTPRSEKKKGKKEKSKLYIDDAISLENISSTMDIFLESCTSEDDDLVQFIRFLFRCANGDIKPNEHKIAVCRALDFDKD